MENETDRLYVQIDRSTMQMCGAWDDREPNITARWMEYKRWIKNIPFDEFVSKWGANEVVLEVKEIVPNDKEVLRRKEARKKQLDKEYAKEWR